MCLQLTAPPHTVPLMLSVWWRWSSVLVTSCVIFLGQLAGNRPSAAKYRTSSRTRTGVFLNYGRHLEPPRATSNPRSSRVLPIALLRQNRPRSEPPPCFRRAGRRGGCPDSSRKHRHPNEVLWWLTWQQARGLFRILALIGFLIGLPIPTQLPLLWPFATLMFGVACGTAAFAPEQRDLSLSVPIGRSIFLFKQSGALQDRCFGLLPPRLWRH